MTETYALIEIRVGPVPDDTKWGTDSYLDKFSVKVADLVADTEFPDGVEGDVQGLIRTASELGLDEPERTVEEVFANLGHHVSDECVHSLHDDCALWCKICRGTCNCHCHEGEVHRTCTTAGHESMRAVGAAAVEGAEGELRSYPYCQDCLDVLARG